MKIFMFDQIHLHRRYLEQEQSENKREKIETWLCIIGLVVIISALIATVIDVICTPDNSQLDNSAYLYEPGDHNNPEQ